MSNRARMQTWHSVVTRGMNALWTASATPLSSSGVLPSTIPTPGGTAYSKIFEAWGGGVLDSDRNQLIIWGGGHSDYAGNEVYAFRLNTLSWARLTTPPSDAVITGSSGIESSGYYATTAVSGVADTQQPRARHSYNNCHYSPQEGKMVVLAGTGIYPSGGGTDNVDLLDPATGLWSQKADWTPSFNSYDIADIDPSTGRIWHYGNTGAGWLNSFLPSTNTKTSHGSLSQTNQALSGSPLDYHYMGSVIVPGLWLYGIGNGKVYRWDISNPAASVIDSVEITTSGDQTIQNQTNTPGLAYHPRSGKIIGWAGGADVFSLDVTTHAWTKLTASGSSVATPTAAQANGTYGRFRRYDTDKFVAVNAYNESVYLLELV